MGIIWFNVKSCAARCFSTLPMGHQVSGGACHRRLWGKAFTEFAGTCLGKQGLRKYITIDL